MSHGHPLDRWTRQDSGTYLVSEGGMSSGSVVMLTTKNGPGGQILVARSGPGSPVKVVESGSCMVSGNLELAKLSSLCMILTVIMSTSNTMPF